MRRKGDEEKRGIRKGESGRRGKGGGVIRFIPNPL
jgi:hypothetical protein